MGELLDETVPFFLGPAPHAPDDSFYCLWRIRLQAFSSHQTLPRFAILLSSPFYQSMPGQAIGISDGNLDVRQRYDPRPREHRLALRITAADRLNWCATCLKLVMAEDLDHQ